LESIPGICSLRHHTGISGWRMSRLAQWVEGTIGKFRAKYQTLVVLFVFD